VRYVCPSCGRWVAPLIPVESVSCLVCGVYARRQEEKQGELFAAAERSEPRRPAGETEKRRRI